jgi:ABC-type multidrug transport system fused ATPase/permease subunit
VIDARSPGRYLLGLAAGQYRTLAAAAGLGSAWMLTQAAVPLVVGRTVDAGVIRANSRALLTGCAVLLGLGALSAVTGVMRHRLAVSNWMQAALRTQQFVGHHVADQGLRVGATITTGEVVETVGGDAPRLGDLYDMAARASGAFVTYLVVAVLLVRMDLAVGLWVAIGLPVLTATLAVVVRPLQARQKQHRETEGRLTALGADTVAGLRVLRGIGGERQFLERYREQSEQVRAAGVRVASPRAGLDAAHVLLPGIFVVALTWLGARAVLAGRLTAGELVTLYGYAAFLRMPLETATQTLSKAVRGRVAAARVVAIARSRESDGRADERVDPIDPALRPPSDSIVRDPESGLTVQPGQLTALVTARPEQAVTITDRLARLERPAGALPAPDAAAPQIGGVSFDELSAEAVRARILLSEAEPQLFTGSLRTVIDPYGRHPDDAVLAALEVADAADLLDALPDGLDGWVQERGREFSGGQRQRLVLARAVLANPELLVLVEPTSSVDAHTEARVAPRLRAARAGRTTLVATASPLLLDLCDRVLFLVDGHVAAEGKHRELLRENADYRRVVTRGEEER